MVADNQGRQRQSGLGGLWLPDEYLAEKFFDQGICSLLRDARFSDNRRHPSLSHSNKARDARRHASQRGCSRENEMQKTILTIAGSALIALSTVQLAAASEHHGRTHHRTPAVAQFRGSNAYAAPAYIAVQPELSGYGYRYSGGYSAPAGR
jgi:hypothetical protein